MKLEEALPIIYLYLDPGAVLHDDHICTRNHLTRLRSAIMDLTRSIRRTMRLATVCPTIADAVTTRR